jgi:membrane-associated protease RseP (regulator of RpoE activity)
METLMIVVSVALSLASVVAHEMGHAFAMRRYGAPIAQAGIGMDWKPMVKIPPRGRREFTLTISPWLIGAYVKPSDEGQKQLDRLPYRDFSWYIGAGIVTNVVIGVLLLALASWAEGRWWPGVAEVAISLIIAALGKYITAYLIPLIGPAVGAFLVWIQFFDPTPKTGGLQVWGSVYSVTSWSEAFAIAGLFSICVGVLNAAPFTMLDGGHIALRLIRTWFGERARMVYGFVSLGVIAAILAGSVIDTFLALWS